MVGVVQHLVAGFVADLLEVLGHVFHGEIGVVVAGGPADEEPGHGAAGRGVHLAGGRTVFMGQKAHHRGDQLRVHGLFDLLAEDGLGHAGGGHRGNAVGLDVVLGPLQGQRIGEPDQAHLGRAVVGLAEVAQHAGIRGGAHDAAIALFSHLVEGRTGDVERPPKMDGQHRVELLVLQLVEGLVPQDAGVVDHDIHPAERLHSGGGDGRPALGSGHRVGVCHRLAAAAVDLVGHFLGRPLAGTGAVGRSAQVVDHQPSPPPGQLQRVQAP